MDESLDRLPCGYLAFHDDGRIADVNSTLCEMLGVAKDQLLDRHIQNIFQLGGRLFYQTHLFPLLKMKGLVEEVYISLRKGDGADVPVLLNASRRENEGQPLSECVLLPIRTRNKYEDEILKAKHAAEDANRAKDEANAALEVAQFALQKQHRELEDRNCELENLREHLEELVQERTAELEKANTELQGFNYTIAHDLRAPIRTLIANAKFLELDYGGHMPAEALPLVRAQVESGLKLAELVNDLLRLSRLGKIPLKRAHLDVSEIARTVTQGLKEEYPRAPAISIAPGLVAEGDPELVRIVIQNLIENAIKFSPSGGEILVERILSAAGEAIAVRDRGIGFDMAFADKVFLPFERLVKEEEFPGNGIGLTNVKRIVERHGGRVWAESTPGVGTDFYFTLPTEVPAHPPDMPQDGPSAEMSQVT